MTVGDGLRSGGRVHIIGAGPVGLLLAALLQSQEGFSVRLYEKRREYTRSRMVHLASYLVADSLESYRADHFDGENVEAVFDPPELAEGLAFRQSIAPDLMALLHKWALGFCPLNAIEQSLSDLIDARGTNAAQRTAAVVTSRGCHRDARAGRRADRLHRQQVAAARSPGTRLRRRRTDANTVNIRLEYALVITFLYGQTYACNEYCKYYKNIENAHYKFIPMVHRTHYDGSISHVTGIVNITAEDYEAMPPRFDGEWLRSNFPDVAQSMDRFIGKIKQETNGEIVGDLEIIRIPLNLYRARNATSRQWRTTGSERPSVRALTGVSARRFGHWLAVLSVDIAGLRVRDVPGGAHHAA